MKMTSTKKRFYSLMTVMKTSTSGTTNISKQQICSKRSLFMEVTRCLIFLSHISSVTFISPLELKISVVFGNGMNMRYKSGISEDYHQRKYRILTSNIMESLCHRLLQVISNLIWIKMA